MRGRAAAPPDRPPSHSSTARSICAAERTPSPRRIPTRRKMSAARAHAAVRPGKVRHSPPPPPRPPPPRLVQSPRRHGPPAALVAGGRGPPAGRFGCEERPTRDAAHRRSQRHGGQTSRLQQCWRQWWPLLVSCVVNVVTQTTVAPGVLRGSGAQLKKRAILSPFYIYLYFGCV